VKEKTMSVYAKLNEARISLQNTELTKSGHNKFAGYRYFELGDFLPAVQDIFRNLNLCGVVSYTAEYATLTIVDIDDKSQIVITSPMGSAALKGCHEVQNIGAVETYQRRYLWVTAMEIVEHDALDSSEPLTTESKKAPEDAIPVEFYIAQLQAKDSPADLRSAYALSYPRFNKNKADQAKLVDAYEKMKAKLNETSGSAA
jgi:hypothetical protein